MIIINIYDVSALSYQNNLDLEFNFEPVLGLSLSSDALRIENLMPGSSGLSNIITIYVETNNISGYILSASVGNSTYPNNDLTNLNAIVPSGTARPKFSSIANTTAGITSLSTPNTWGYTIDNGATYNGLTHGVYTILTSTQNNSGPKTTTFGIGAYADNAQTAGDYSNVISFNAIANPKPPTIEDAYKANGKEKYKGYYTMQDMSSAICSMVDYGAEARLIDVRDNSIYLVGKLKDNNCWMLDNLKFSDISVVLTNDNTNVAYTNEDDYTLPHASGTWSNSYTNAYINDEYSNDIVASYGNGSGKVGVYYNYCAASAGTYCYADGDGVDIPNSTTDAPYDICPKNWRLPTGGSNGEYQNLYSLYNNVDSFNTAFSTLLSGYFISGNADHRNNFGLFWSSTYSDNSGIYYTYTSSSTNYQESGNRNNGFSIRCLVR